MISQKRQALVEKVAEKVEQTGTEVISKVSRIADGRVSNITEEAIHAAVDQAINVLEVAGDKVREKRLDAERVSLQVEVGISG